MTEKKRKNILCALDISDHTRKTLDEALWQAEKSGAFLTILHVLNERMFEELERWQGRIPTLGVDLVDQAFGQIGDEREEQLRTILKEAGADRVDHKTLIIRGYPLELILQTAEEIKADMIVMGVVGRGSLIRRIRVGSRTEKVIRRAGCDVLLVR